MTGPAKEPVPSGTSRPSRWLMVRSCYLDRILGAILMPVLGPIVLALMCIVRRGDGSPAVVGLPRTGAGGGRFRMWKLRTMRVAAADGSAGGAVITLPTDIRVTLMGRRLRRLRLDELPQLANVVMGDMALLGPRPETPSLVDPEDPMWQAVLAVRPGITGPTQLVVEAWEAEALKVGDPEERYRHEILPIKLAIDRWYVERASPSLDLVIVWSMVERFVLGRSKTSVERRARAEVPESAAIPAHPGR